MFLNNNEYQKGDLLFFGKTKSESDIENAILEVVPGNYYHIGIFDSNSYIIHACSQGVISELLSEAIKRIEPDYIEICSVNLPAEVRSKAVDKARSVIGCPYNDLFSWNYLNSEGKKSFYCSQLITFCYEEFKVPFPEHKMNFSDDDGNILPYWIEYYKSKKQLVPQSQPGSHPSQIRSTCTLTTVGKFKTNLQKKILEKI